MSIQQHECRLSPQQWYYQYVDAADTAVVVLGVVFAPTTAFEEGMYVCVNRYDTPSREYEPPRMCSKL